MDHQDYGTHVVCAKVTAEFLAYLLQRGIDTGGFGSYPLQFVGAGEPEATESVRFVESLLEPVYVWVGVPTITLGALKMAVAFWPTAKPRLLLLCMVMMAAIAPRPGKSITTSVVTAPGCKRCTVHSCQGRAETLVPWGS